MQQRQPWILDWQEAAAAGPALAGGKGWNLGRLARYGFRVPVGGVVSSKAYEQFMADPVLKQLQDDLRSISADDATTADNVNRLEAMQTAIHNTPLPDEITAHIHEFLASNDLATVPIAVRSSATAEDSATASFAGIHGSRLGQVGPDAVVDGIRACYASLWTPRAVAYRRRLGLSDADVSCAIVLCRMVGADDDPSREPAAAGVAFSCDPRTGRLDIVTIGSVRGLGEKLVDGRTKPEELAVEANVQFTVIERSGADAPVLTDDEAIRLAHVVTRIQWALGDGQVPQDVEWAFDGHSFWIVQARPVTGLPRHTFPEAKQLPLVWSNANLKDALPGVLSPLGWSFALLIVRHNLFAPHMAAGYPIPPGLEGMRRFSGRAYFDLTSLFWAFYDALGMTASEFNRSLGGHQPEFSVPEPDPMKGPHARRRNRARLKVLRAVLRLDKTLPGEMRARMDEVRRQRDVDLTPLSLQQLRQRLQEEIARAYNFGMRSMMSNTSAGLWHQFLEMVLTKIAPDDAATLASDVTAGSGNVVSAEYGHRLFDLAQIARDDADARALLDAEPTDGSPWRRLPHASPFRRELEGFMDDFGHRGVYEVDIGNPRWIEDATYILEQINHLLDADIGRDLRAVGRQRREDAERAIARRTFALRPLIRWLARRARHGSALREEAKSTLVSYLEPCRYVMVEVGRRMHEDGILENPNDVFYLTWIEIDAFMCSWWDGAGARTIVQDRKQQHNEWLDEEPPDVIMDDDGNLSVGDSVPQVAPTGPSTRAADRRGLPSDTLHGTGVAAGTVRGRVRIVRHPNEGGSLETGEILVAPSTDPGWTPLFMRAAAVVMEVGGYHSHGAIVVREFGIPAVANIPGLLDTLRNGDIITVHGDEGVIVRQTQ